MKTVFKRRAGVEFKSSDKVMITTPYKQKSFNLTNGTVYIDLISLSTVSHREVTTKCPFFLELYREKGYVHAIAYAKVGERGHDEIDSVVLTNSPKLMEATIEEDD